LNSFFIFTPQLERGIIFSLAQCGKGIKVLPCERGFRWVEEGLSPPLAGGGRGWGISIGLISWISWIGLISANQAQDYV